MEKKDPSKDSISVLYENELAEDSEHSILVSVESSQDGLNEPGPGSNNPEPGCSTQEPSLHKPEPEFTKKEVSLPGENPIVKKTRFSVLQEFDPLCKKTIEDPHARASEDDVRDADSISEKRSLLETDETETEAVYSSVSADSSESTPTFTTSAQNSGVLNTIAIAEDVVGQVEYDKSVDAIATDEAISINTSDIFYPTVEHPVTDEQITDVTQYLDTLSTTDYTQSFKTVKPSIGISEEYFEIDSLILAAIRSISSMTDVEAKKIMSDITEKMDQMKREMAELKLQLNSMIQVKASLELQLGQKDEVILKAQAELIVMEQSHKHDVRMLKEQLKEHSKLIQKGGPKNLEEELKSLREREAKFSAELAGKSKESLNYQKTLDAYEKKVKTVLDDYAKQVDLYQATKQHLANLEMSFSDVHHKYEKSKEIIESYVTNEQALIEKLDIALAINLKHEEKYESLKAHAKNQIDKSNSENMALKEKYEAQIEKLTQSLKLAEIKLNREAIKLQQKTEECDQLTAFCDEITKKSEN